MSVDVITDQLGTGCAQAPAQILGGQDAPGIQVPMAMSIDIEMLQRHRLGGFLQDLKVNQWRLFDVWRPLD